jgi:type I restriction enzyme S subunit
VFTVVNGGTPTSEPENWDGDVSWATPVDLGRSNGARLSETQRTLTTGGLRTGSSLVPAGSLIVSTRAPIGYVVETTTAMAFNQGCRGLVPRADIDVRFFRYQLHAVAEQLQSRGQGSTFVELSTDALASFPLVVPPLGEQRAIADFLDAKTARIDALLAARGQMLQLVGVRLDGLITSALDRPDWSMAPLKWKTRVTVGIVVRPSELYVEQGVPCLRGFNVRPGSVNDSDLAFISPAANALNSKSTLAAGDVVVVRTGKAGAAAVVPEWASGGNCVDLLIVRRTGDIDVRFLEAVLNSAVVRRQIEEMSVGALQAHFNTEALANLRVPVPSQREQAAALALIDAARSSADAMRSTLTRQIELLLERRQALITAAVTGQLDIPGVAA